MLPVRAVAHENIQLLQSGGIVVAEVEPVPDPPGNWNHINAGCKGALHALSPVQGWRQGTPSYGASAVALPCMPPVAPTPCVCPARLQIIPRACCSPSCGHGT